jgi:hypothetical protein
MCQYRNRCSDYKPKRVLCNKSLWGYQPSCFNIKPEAPAPQQGGVSSSSDLLCCPFCGWQPTSRPETPGDSDTWWIVECDNPHCDVRPLVMKEKPPEAGIAWNSRAV